MAVTEYTVKRGDSLSKIAKEYSSVVAGNTLNAKVDTLVALNGINDRDLIYVGQVIKLTASGGTQASSAAAAAPSAQKVTIVALNVTSESSTNRDFVIAWTWNRENTDKFVVRWEYDYSGDTRVYETKTSDEYSTFTIPTDFQKTANWVQAFIKPVAKTYESKDSSGNVTQVPYWTDVEEVGKWLPFTSLPPLVPPVPSVSINNDTMTLTAEIGKVGASNIYATSIQFHVMQDHTVNLGVCAPIAITDTDYVSFQYPVSPGHSYSVRACSVGSNGLISGWSDFSTDDAGTLPPAPERITTYRRQSKVDANNGTTTYSVYLEWTPASTAETYKIEYTDTLSNFESANGQYSSVETKDATASALIDISELGSVFYFRIRSINKYGTSGPTAVVELPLGSLPNAPTTWSTSDSAFSGEGDDLDEIMELHWTHNPTDNSRQTSAELEFKVDGNDWFTLTLINETDSNSTEEVTKTFSYGTAVSYKGDLYFKMDTNHRDFKNKKIIWRVRTAGVTNEFNKEGWSAERTIYIYEKPTLGLSMTTDASGTGGTILTLTSFPFYIKAQDTLTDYTIQKPVGYHVRIVSNDHYVTVDDIGREKTINEGDSVYSKYFDTSNILHVVMSADNIDLETGISYTLYCTENLSSGLSISNQHDFTVSWVDVEYAINATISIDTESYTALITPYCREKIPVGLPDDDGEYYGPYEDGDLVENVTLSIYRREYDGQYTKVASDIPNRYTAVIDPHPALDYARYRFIAKDVTTGAISFYDMAGYPVNGSAIIIQWDEEWHRFDVTDNTSAENVPWNGSLLKLPYNIKVTDKRSPEVSLVEYAGRQYPVSYYGTQIGESHQWSADIPADDKETIYALRRLSIWPGDVYIREPSGMGYWANVNVSFNKSYDDVVIPVSLDITRVEGGV